MKTRSIKNVLIKSIIFFLSLGILGAVAVTAYRLLYPTPKTTLAWAQEYEPHSELPEEKIVRDYSNINNAYKIGTNQKGSAVFKDPEAAFQQLKKDCADAVQAIKTEYKLLPLNNFTFQFYAHYSSQFEDKDTGLVDQLNMVTDLLNIYQNSF